MTATNGDFIVSLIRDAIDTAPVETKLSDVIRGIADGRWEGPVKTVRSAFESGGKKAADAPKKKLPGILFSGTFSHRSNDKLLNHSGLICVDLDKLDDQTAAWKEKLASDPHCLCAFVSPTGSGVKAVFRCNPVKDHIESFHAAERYVKEQFGLQIDAACKDVARICFVSHDPEAHLEPHAKMLPYPEPAEPEEFHEPASAVTGSHPGDDYDKLDEWKAVMKNKGWKEEHPDHWTRPGKDRGTSATWNKCKVPDRFWCFSSDAPPFIANKMYRPWHIYALLEHHGEWKDAARALGKRGMGKPIKDWLDQNLDRVAGEKERPSVLISARPIFTLNVPQPGDATTILGNRYLSRGDGAVLSSTSGMGKSAMAIQMAIRWGLEMECFGIKPARALRILYVQSEDSDGDVAEVTASIAHVMKLTPEQIAAINLNVVIVSDRVNRGDRFLASLRQHIAGHKPDLVIINPLQAFIDGDITASKDLGRFLREGLNLLNEPASFAYLLIHHTTKPATGKDRAERLWHEVMYDMAGGAEIINWARAILSLRATPTEGQFNLVLAKRGRRAGVTKQVPQGTGWRLEVTTVVPLKHAADKLPSGQPMIYWEARPEDAPMASEKKGRPERYLYEDYRNLFPPKSGPGKPLSQLARDLMPNGEIRTNQLHQVCKRWQEQGHVEIMDRAGQPRLYRSSF